MAKTINSGVMYSLSKGKLKPIKVCYDMKVGVGAESFYFQLSAKRGIKLFKDKQNARMSFTRQNKAHKYRLAPKVFSKDVLTVFLPMHFEMLMQKGNDRFDLSSYFYKGSAWGYVTEHAKVLEKREKKPSDEEIYSLRNKLRRILPRCLFNDLHRYNLEFIGKKLVNIDFGRLSSN